MRNRLGAKIGFAQKPLVSTAQQVPFGPVSRAPAASRKRPKLAFSGSARFRATPGTAWLAEGLPGGLSGVSRRRPGGLPGASRGPPGASWGPPGAFGGPSGGPGDCVRCITPKGVGSSCWFHACTRTGGGIFGLYTMGTPPGHQDRHCFGPPGSCRNPHYGSPSTLPSAVAVAARSKQDIHNSTHNINNTNT